MRNVKLVQMRNLRVITTPEFMLLNAYFHGNFDQFLKGYGRNKQALRELYVSGMNKIKKHFKRNQ